jgi:rhodanese-related sulfurtransferase
LTAKDFLDKGECIFLDARTPDVYAEDHIRGARNWPADSFDTYLTTVGEEVPKEGCVVAYCIGGTCDESYHLVMSLLAEGYKEVYLYEGGIEGWKLADLPVETGPDPSAREESETDPE